MSTPVDGFRKTLGQTLRDLHKDCVQKVGSLEGQLTEQREALAFVERVAAAAGEQLSSPQKKSAAEEAPSPDLKLATA